MSKKYNNELAYYREIMREFPTASKEENLALILRARDNDQEARELILKKNIGLVLQAINRCHFELQSLDEEDLVQEGMIKLDEIIDSYDESLSAFSTYAITCISRHLTQAVRKTDKTIRRKSGLIEARKIYNEYISRFLKDNLPIPDYETIKRDLHMTDEMFTNVILDSGLDPRSLSEPLKDSDNETTLGEVTGSYEQGFIGLLDSMVDDEMTACLKAELSAFEYYIVYKRFLSTTPLSTREVADTLNMPFNAFDFYEKKVLKRLRKYFDDAGSFNGTISQETRKLLEIGYLNLQPITPKKIAKFLFLRDYLTAQERELYFEKYFENINYSPIVVAHKWNVSEEQIYTIEEDLEHKISEILKDNADSFESFSKNLIGHYKYKIFDIDLNTADIDEFKKDYKRIASIWNDRTYEDLISLIGESAIPESMRDKVKTYFGYMETTIKMKFQLERKLNCLISGLFENDAMSKTQLREGLSRNPWPLTRYQRAKIDLFFGKITKSEFQAIMPNFDLKNSTDNLFELLHSIYFNITNYNRMDFSEERYKRIKKLCKDSIPTSTIKLLDYYFSLKGENVQKKMTEFLNSVKTASTTLSEEEALNVVQSAKDQVLNIYIGRSSKLQIDYDIYREYLKKVKLDLREPTNTIMRMFLFEGASYDEIAAKLGISNKKVSVYITSAIWRIDFSRFGIIEDHPYSDKTLIRNLQESDFTDIEKSALREYIVTMDGAGISKKYGIPTKNLDTLMTKLKHLCRDEALGKVTLMVYDIKRKVEAYETENVLSIQERKILSLYYGLKNIYNPDGKTLNLQSIASIFGVTHSTISVSRKHALEAIKLSILGIEKAPLDFISKSELERLLEDPHVPLKKESKELLRNVYDLNGKCMSLEEISENTTQTVKRIRYNVYRAVATLRRYQNGEIEGIYSYEYDVEPYLRYFTLHDRNILVDYYRDSLTFEQLEKKYGYSYGELTELMLRLRVYLKDSRQGFPPCIDFDKFYENVDKEDVPFYGNRLLAKELFILFYERGISIKELSRKVHPELSERLIQSIIIVFTSAVMKRSIGIKKTRDFSYEEVRDYYLAHHEDMSIWRKTLFYNYLNRIDRNTPYYKRQTPIEIADLLLRETDDYLYLDECTKEKAKKLITKYRTRLTKREIDSLLLRFGISPREFMKGSDQRQVLDFLYDVESSSKKEFVLHPKV